METSSKPSNIVNNGQAPTLSQDAVFKASDPVPDEVPEVDGIEFNNYKDQNITAADLVESQARIGFQGQSIAEAARIINNMRNWRDPETNAKTTIFLGYTSNLVSSGLRSTLRWLVEHSHVSAIVTTAGGIEEDLIKCLGPTYLSSFSAPGAALRAKGLNRIGNLIVPNENYCKFEDWIMPILDAMLAEQEEDATTKARKTNNNNNNNDNEDPPLIWTPSTVIARLGKEMNHDSSICTWAHRNHIPIFCPALTDGSLGDMLHFHSFRASPHRLLIDIVQDIRRINEFARAAPRAGMVVLGGGVVKHHIANACLMRNGAESAVFVNTAQEFDGSDAGARPDEAVSWGKIAVGAESVKVFAEATTVFNQIVAATWAKTGEGEEG